MFSKGQKGHSQQRDVFCTIPVYQVNRASSKPKAVWGFLQVCLLCSLVTPHPVSLVSFALPHGHNPPLPQTQKHPGGPFHSPS